MNVAISQMPLDSPLSPSNPLILEGLIDINIPSGHCPRRVGLQLDLMLLALEAAHLGSGEAILGVSQEMGLQGIIDNRVNLWRIRSTNPLRRYHQRRYLSQMEAKALVAIICYMARRLTVRIRQLLSDYQRLTEKEIPLEQDLSLGDYLERFRAHFRSRMNPRRAGVMAYSSNDKLDNLAIELLEKLLFCTGTSGMQRFWISLFDGEVL